jgi:hypothetical protein
MAQDGIFYDDTAGVFEVFIAGEWIGAYDTAADAREARLAWVQA